MMLWLLAGCAGTPAPQGPSPYGPAVSAPRAEKIIIEKSARKMILYKKGQPWKSYDIALGKGGVAPKKREGDQRTPEGIYYIENRNPRSIYHLGLRLNYPNEDDIARGRRLGVNPGSHIMIHGLPNGKGWIGRRHLLADWTEGCIAVTNEEIEDIWDSVADGTPVEIRS